MITEHGQALNDKQKAIYDAGYRAGFFEALALAAKEIHHLKGWAITDKAQAIIESLKPPQEYTEAQNHEDQGE